MPFLEFRHDAMSTLPRFDAAWKSWLDDNIRRGCTHQSLIDAMVAAAFHPNTARLILARHLAGDAVAPDEAASSDYMYGKPMLPEGRVLSATDCVAPKLFSSEQPVVALVADVLTPAECDRLIEIGRERVQRSSVVDPDSGSEITIEERRSEGAFVNASTDPLVDTVDRRLAELFAHPVENGRGSAYPALRYRRRVSASLRLLSRGTGGQPASHAARRIARRYRDSLSQRSLARRRYHVSGRWPRHSSAARLRALFRIRQRTRPERSENPARGHACRGRREMDRDKVDSSRTLSRRRVNRPVAYLHGPTFSHAPSAFVAESLFAVHHLLR